ncbi:MAG: YHS domain-containing (seleno)protein, partial [Pseudomonadales bacterium]
MSGKLLAGASMVALLLLSTPVWAIDAIYTGFFSNDAIDGYDAVAYFTQGEPVRGRDEFSFQWRVAVWKFSSAEHLQMFSA